MDALISGQGIVLSILAGLFITVLILIQGFWVLGVNVVILALGARIAGVVFKGVTTMMAGSDVVFGDGSDRRSFLPLRCMRGHPSHRHQVAAAIDLVD